MPSRRKKRLANPSGGNIAAAERTASPAGTKLTKRKLLLFKLVALVGIPILFFGVLELLLRLFGFGYSTDFILSIKQNDRAAFVQNNRFGWRFFGPGMARAPKPFCVPQTKMTNTVRIVVYGESAALGDPQPEFGVARMLQAMLELRYPETKFEVINAGIVAINSNVILPIVQDCVKLNADIWVIYMGNNEVVGPFGAGTVFGRQVPPLPVIRSILALKSTRLGQAVDFLLSKTGSSSASKSEWGGMEMFLDQQVSLHDPRMAAVYSHFTRNLSDMIEIGRRSGVGIVVSTVPVNLKDCAPFASLHRPGLSSSDFQDWENFYQKGTNAENAGDVGAAMEWYRKATQIDDQFAELRFREGDCLSALGDTTNASAQFSTARDLDALRFRCDSHLNDLIRQAVSSCTQPNVLLADAENIFATQSPSGIPGEKYFYEHVHLTFEGNYLLALTLMPEVQKLLPPGIASQTSQNQPWPSVDDCARRLAWSKQTKAQALTEIISRLKNPPFTGQLNHDEQVLAIKDTLFRLGSETSQDEGRTALNLCETALAAHPDDTDLLEQACKLKQLSGDLAGAEMLMQKTVDLLPGSSEDWSQLGVILAKQKKYEDAAKAFHKAFELNPEDVFALQNLAQTLNDLGRKDEAMSEYKHALAIKPGFGLAWLGLGQMQEAAGNKNEADVCYQKALQNRILRAPELAALAHFCESRGWLEAAATNYQDAINLDPSDPKIYLAAGQNLSTIGRHAAAEKYFAEASVLAPNSVQAFFLYGSEMGRDGKPAEAAKQFQRVVILMPDLMEGHLNLGISLADAGNYRDAIVQFEQVLQRDSNNSTALQYLKALRLKLQ